MSSPGREALFDALVVLAVGLGQTSFLLGVGVAPPAALVVGLVLVGVGTLTLVPERTRVPAAATGFVGVTLAGGVVPVYAARAVSAGETLPVSLLLAGVVLLLTFAVLRVTTFGPRALQHG